MGCTVVILFLHRLGETSCCGDGVRPEALRRPALIGPFPALGCVRGAAVNHGLEDPPPGIDEPADGRPIGNPVSRHPSRLGPDRGAGSCFVPKCVSPVVDLQKGEVGLDSDLLLLFLCWVRMLRKREIHQTRLEGVCVSVCVCVCVCVTYSDVLEEPGPHDVSGLLG